MLSVFFSTGTGTRPPAVTLEDFNIALDIFSMRDARSEQLEN